MFTLICALHATAAVIPSVIAQEEDGDVSLDNDQDLASGIVSEVLDGGDDDDENDQDATNTGTVNPNQDQTLDQDNVGEFGDDTGVLDGINVTVPLAVPIDIDIIEEAPPITPTPPEEEEPPEFVAFCLVSSLLPEASLCFDTSEECEIAEEFLDTPDASIISFCDGVEMLPPNALICVNVEEEGELTGGSCVSLDT